MADTLPIQPVNPHIKVYKYNNGVDEIGLNNIPLHVQNVTEQLPSLHYL